MATYYLAGPMRGKPQFNFPLFEKVAGELRDRGYSIVSPHELDSTQIRDEALASSDGILKDFSSEGQGKIGGETWGDILARDVKEIANKVEGIIFLPDWEKSSGARLEAYVGLLKGVVFFEYSGEENDLTPASPAYIAGVCAAQWMEEPFKKFYEQEMANCQGTGVGESAAKAVTVAV